jgi:hypothetical protein
LWRYARGAKDTLLRAGHFLIHETLRLKIQARVVLGMISDLVTG